MSDDRDRTGGLVPAMGLPALATDDLRQRLHTRLIQPGPADAAAGLQRGDDLDGARILVPVLDIRPYDRNPRRALNPRFDEIKASIRAVGLLTPFNITRRPGEAHYMVCGGGNTRLAILQQLLREGDIRFERVELTFKAWRGDAEAIAGHIGENDQRGEMSFWDRAAGIMDVKAALEAQAGNPLSLRQLEAELKRLGLPVALANLSLMKFALERLAPLGQRLTGLDVKRIQPRLNLMKRLAALWALDEAAIHGRIIDPALHEHILALGPDAGAESERLLRRWEAALATHLGIEGKRLTQMLAALEKTPGAQRQDLELCGTQSTPPFTSQTATCPPTVTAPFVQEADPDTKTTREPPPITPEHISPQLLRDTAERLARAGGVAGWFAPLDSLPLGYYMEAAPLPQNEDQDLRGTLWWLLAAASGQMDPDLALGLPEDSRWRRVYLREAGMDESAYPFLVEDDLLAHTTREGLAVVDPWSLFHLLQHEALAAQCLELARLVARVRTADTVAYRHLSEPTHRRGSG